MSDNDKNNVSDDDPLNRKRKRDENQNRTHTPKKRKRIVDGQREWNETDIEIGNDNDGKNDKAIQSPIIDISETDGEHNENVPVQTKFPQKIGDRRKSVRLLNLASKKESTPKQQANGNKKSKSEQGKPHGTHDKSKSTEETEQSSNRPKSSSSSSDCVESTVDSAFKTKSELSALVLKQFSDIKKVPKLKSTYTARCNHCDDRKNFQKGINSNLKSHLERVIFVRLFQSFHLLLNLHCI